MLTKFWDTTFLQRYRNIANILIGGLWLLSIGTALFLARYGELIPTSEKDSINRSGIPKMEFTDSSIIFSSTGAFMDYFRVRYKDAEISNNLLQSASESGGAIIEVEKKTTGNTKKNDENKNGKFRFKIKPVPE